MNPLDLLYETTKQLHGVLNQPITAQNREDVIEQVNQLIEKRGTTMTDISPPFSAEEEKIGKELVELNVQIEEKMKELFEEIKEDMRRVNQQKKSNRSYVNPYRNMGPTDGMYHDSKQ